MNGSLISADRLTHLKIVALALVAATAVVIGAITARFSLADSLSQTVNVNIHGPVVKAGASVIVSATNSQLTR